VQVFGHGCDKDTKDEQSPAVYGYDEKRTDNPYQPKKVPARDVHGLTAFPGLYAKRHFTIS
jgi:hypothetical protein